MARHSVWTRANLRNGLERPHFVATGTVAVLQPSGQDDSLFTMCFARVQLGQEETRKEIMSVI